VQASIGEQIVGAYLFAIEKCDLVQYNIKIHDNNRHGEIDVVGINLQSHTVYFCEVATHLITGIQYVKNKRPNNVNKLYSKFKKDIYYAKKYFNQNDYIHRFMLWSPVVKITVKENKIWDQIRDLRQIYEKIYNEFDIKIEFIINEIYNEKLQQLILYSRNITREPEMPIIRTLQIIERSKKYSSLLKKKNIESLKHIFNK